MKIKVAVIGATGYAGAELVRLLLSHPSKNSSMPPDASTGTGHIIDPVCGRRLPGVSSAGLALVMTNVLPFRSMFAL